MEERSASTRSRLSAVMRDGERVKPLELFFDLIFVLAITQCTALMYEEATWASLGQGLLVLALLWWSWVGYAWLTSVVDPEEGLVRFAVFGAMAALLVAALAVPDAFGDDALAFAVAYSVVRAAHIALFILASRDDPELRRSTLGLGAGTAVGATLLIVGSLLEPGAQAAVWALALGLDMAEPYFFGSEGWKLAPGHFAERHWLIVIVALGESIVALGFGSEVGLSAGVIAAAALGMAAACALWWIYFDVVALVGARRLIGAEPGRPQNELARDAYSYLHFPLVAGIVMSAFGLHEVLAHVDDPLKTVPAVALLAGFALYLLGHVAIRLRHVQSWNRDRLLLALVLVALIPLAVEISSLAILTIAVALLWALIGRETARYGTRRQELRWSFDHED